GGAAHPAPGRREGPAAGCPRRGRRGALAPGGSRGGRRPSGRAGADPRDRAGRGDGAPGRVSGLRLTALTGLGVELLGAGALAATGPGSGGPVGSAARPIRAEATFSGGFNPRRVVARPGAGGHFRSAEHLRPNAAAALTIHGRPAFRSGSPTSGSFQLRAPARRGVYTYTCQVHGFMQGTLVVRRSRAGRG